MEVVIGDGTTRRFGPGDAVLFEDLTGQGHTSRSVGGDRLTAIVPLADVTSTLQRGGISILRLQGNDG